MMRFDAHSGDVFLDVFSGAPERRVRAGESLIHAGEEASQVFNILEGTLMVSRIGKDGRRQVLSFLFRNNFVGLTATDHYFFTVEAISDAVVVSRPRTMLEKHLEKDPLAERAFLQMVFRVLENSLDLVYSLGQRTAIERAAVFLLYIRHRVLISTGAVNDSDDDLSAVALPMSRQDIADFLGLKKETVSRSFTELERKGLIARPHAHAAELKDLSGLRELAGIMDFASPLRLVTADGDKPGT
ncbi:MAG: Crp/Fnr family transcriptional regulator [Gammaproteobacteria bacterium]